MEGKTTFLAEIFKVWFILNRWIQRIDIIFSVSFIYDSNKNLSTLRSDRFNRIKMSHWVAEEANHALAHYHNFISPIIRTY